MTVLETKRLVLRHLTEDDAPFIAELVNDPDWLRYIGDKKVHSRADAVRYLREGPLAMYERHGHGLYAVVTKESGVSVGICGLIKREGLADVDLGFAFLPAHRGLGYALEAAAATLDHAHRMLSLRRVVAITNPANAASATVLTRLGMCYERKVTLGGAELDLYVSSLARAG